MSTRNMYEYVTGEFTQISILQEPAGVDVKPIFDQNSVQLAGYDIEIWADAVQLIEAVDYTLQLRDDSKSSAEGFDIWGGYLIINPAYEDIELSVISKIVGGYTFRTYRPTYLNVTASSTITEFTYDDIVVYVDTDLGDVALTVGPANRKNQMLTIIASGTNKCTIFRDDFPEIAILDQGTQFAFNGSAWVQLGATGGGAGNAMAVGQAAWYAGIGTPPVDKLLCDGSVHSITQYPSLFNALGTTYGGDGLSTFGVPDLQGIFPGSHGVQGTHGDAGWNIGDLVEDSIESHEHAQAQHTHTMPTHRHSGGGGFLNTGTTQLAYGYTTYGSNRSTANNNNTANNRLPWTSTVDPGDTNQSAAVNVGATGGTETRPASIIGRWLIQAFDSVQEVPANPGLIPTYVLKWGETIGDTPAQTVPNTWGEGLFFIGYNYQYGANRIYSNAFMGVAFDGENREILFDTDIQGADSIIRGVFDFATTTFQVNDIGSDFSDPLITSIFKYESVATGQLNPPVDGWGVVYDVPSNTLPVPNAWGAGTYEITFSDVIAEAHLNVDITITEDDLLSNDSVDGASLNSASNGLIPNYTGGTTNAFDAVTYGAFVGNITKIRKFSGLLNVVHSYTHDIGYVYTQYPNKKSPIELGIPGTWTDISSEMAGLFFRAEGGAASAFESGTQAEEFKEHTHIQNSHTHTITGTSSAGGSSNAIMMNGDNLGNKSWTSNSRTAVNQNSGGVETRPTNVTIRLWERTA